MNNQIKEAIQEKIDKEHTPTIAEMSEAVATYEGWSNFLVYAYLSTGKFNDYYLDWNRLHEAWEKVRDYDAGKEYFEYERFKYIIEYKFLKGTPLETLTALYNAIQFINQLKQQENEKSI
jgi:hypothetical protein